MKSSDRISVLSIRREWRKSAENIADKQGVLNEKSKISCLLQYSL